MDDAITISNSCILPEGWTVDTLMEPYDSKPYNPDIANVFYRAGVSENWGQGIQKICDECQGIGAELPVYKLVGTTLRLHFKALESALIDKLNDNNVLYFAAQMGYNKERWWQHGNTKCERPFTVELPSGIKTLDTFADEEFDEMMRAGLEQSRFF